ncbi:MAG: hypothetical protein K5643_04890 [Saccharofermentans sp.]|nr:hypothetical protein [Saccharofermentans sp.]
MKTPVTKEDKTKRLCIGTLISVIAYIIVFLVAMYVSRNFDFGAIQGHIASFINYLMGFVWSTANIALSIVSMVSAFRDNKTMVPPAVIATVFSFVSPVMFFLFYVIRVDIYWFSA